jgi:anti-anti-sigma factor
MAHIVKKTKDGVLNIQGPLDISSAESLKQIILDSFDQAENVNFLLHENDVISFAGLQLLCSSCKTAKGRNKEFSVIGGEEKQFSRFTKLAGFMNKECCQDGSDHCCLDIANDRKSNKVELGTK